VNTECNKVVCDSCIRHWLCWWFKFDGDPVVCGHCA